MGVTDIKFVIKAQNQGKEEGQKESSNWVSPLEEPFPESLFSVIYLHLFGHPTGSEAKICALSMRKKEKRETRSAARYLVILNSI